MSGEAFSSGKPSFETRFEMETGIVRGENAPSDQVIPKFIGQEQFQPEVAQQIQSIIDIINSEHQGNLRTLCTQNGIGWRPDGFPDDAGINEVLQALNIRERAYLGVSTAQLLRQSITPEVLRGLTAELVGKSLDETPTTVKQFFDSR